MTTVLSRKKCLSCGAEIVWVEMQSGRRMPLDAKPQKLIVIEADKGEVKLCFTSHFATCPDAAEHRRKP
ncbi:MAG TPA: hypothetical protein VFQ61_06515 [Polyangiaceae bacterium]|nr:hypothetical protein [Polyangiaceae bacterium]